jgi:hypothetical protein
VVGEQKPEEERLWVTLKGLEKLTEKLRLKFSRAAFTTTNGRTNLRVTLSARIEPGLKRLQSYAIT